MLMDISTFARFVCGAKENALKEQIRAQWNTLLPLMSVQMLKYMSFDEYFDKCTGRGIDLRPTEDILAEVEEIRRNRKEK